MKSIKTPTFTWLYFENPDKDDLAALQKTFDLHPIVLEELITPTYRPRIEDYGDYLFMVFHFPIFNEEERITEAGEIDVLISGDYLVTSCNKHQPSLFRYFEELKKVQEETTGDMNGKIPKESFLLLLNIIDKMLISCFSKLDHISDDLDRIEEAIFKGNEKEMVREISIVKRNILKFGRIIKPQRSILESLAKRETIKEDLNLRTKINDVIGTNVRVRNIIESHKETIDSLEATNDSLFSYKLNETMKTLTVVSIVFLPASLTAGLFGMNITAPMDNFWIVLGFIAILMLSTLLIFKSRRWI